MVRPEPRSTAPRRGGFALLEGPGTPAAVAPREKVRGPGIRGLELDRKRRIRKVRFDVSKRPMYTTKPAIRDLARRLIAVEAARDPSDGPVGASVRACEKLRGPLAKLAGVTGFRSLLTRALAMALAEIPSLAAVRVRPDGSLEGWDGTDRIPTAEDEAGVVVLAQLLGLLVTLIGEPLTLRLVRDAWSDAPVDDTDRRGEGQS